MTENGCAIEPKETTDGAPGATEDTAVNDTGRIAYFQGYLEEMHNAIQLGADVRAVSRLQLQILVICLSLFFFLSPRMHHIKPSWVNVKIQERMHVSHLSVLR